MNFLKRHGGYFRPEAHGYTHDILQAGIFSDEESRRYADIDSPPVEIIPIESKREVVAERLKLAEYDTGTAKRLLDLIEASS